MAASAGRPPPRGCPMRRSRPGPSTPAIQTSSLPHHRSKFFAARDAGLSWQAARLESGAHKAIAVAASDGNVVYLGGRPALRSTDRGVTWEPMPVVLPGEQQQTQDVSGIVVAPDDAGALWAALTAAAFSKAAMPAAPGG